MRIITTVLVVLALPVLAADPAGAATYTAAPAGSGAACSAAAPCALATGAGKLNSGDTLDLVPGAYGSAATPLANLAIPPGATLAGPDAGPLPVLRLAPGTAEFAIAATGGATVRRVEAIADGAAGSYGVLLGNVGSTAVSTLDRAIVRNLAPALTRACVFNGEGLMTGSVCWATQGIALRAIPTGGTMTVRGSTAVGSPASGGLSGGQVSAGVTDHLAVVNSILQGGVAAQLDTQSGGSWQADVTSTNLAGSVTGLGAGSPTNVTADPPAFVDAAAGDLRQLPTSTGTIDRGNDGVPAPSFDLDGDLRSIGAHVDLGADERSLVPAVTGSGASGVGPAAATVVARVATGGAATSIGLELGPTGAYGTTIAGGGLAPALGDGPVAIPITGLAPGTTYHARVVATNANGVAQSADVAFTTPVPAPPSGGATRPSLDAAAPKLTLAALRGGAVRGGAVGLRIVNANAVAVTATLRLRTGTVSATTRVTIPAGATRAVRFKLPAKLRRALRRAGGRGRLTATLTAPDGSRATVARSLRLRL